MNIKAQSGFSLLEVFIAFIILAIGIIALGRVQGLFLINENLAEQKAEATNLAHVKMEQFRSYTKLTGGGNSYENIVSGSESVTGRNTVYTLVWTVTDNADPNYKNINMRVTWTGQDGVSRALTLPSIISEIDPAAAGYAIQPTAHGGGGAVMPPA